MPKRRRERDRPKAGPDSVYNPNKRVLLSYASDEEEEDVSEQRLGTGHIAASEAVAADYTIAPYPEDEEEYVPELLEESAKGEASIPAQDESAENSATEHLDKQPFHHKRKPTRHGITGQWPALGSLSYDRDDEVGSEDADSYDSTEEEAMAYLKAVRNERMALPEVLRAQLEDEDAEIYGTGIGDARGYVKDGAYVGRPDIGPVMPPSAHTQIPPFEAYTASLRKRFLDQRERMHSDASPKASVELDEDRPTTFDLRNNRMYALWTRVLKSTAPLPAQVRALDVKAVTELLQLVQRMFLLRGEYLHDVTSIWIWSLLARLDDVGTMNNEEVYTLREFGKRAVLVQLSFFDPAAAALLEAVHANECEGAAKANTDGDANVEADKAAGKSKNLPDTSSSSAQNTLITLDAIITIIGEVFGQRDLLEFRREWPSGSSQEASEEDASGSA